MRKWVLVVDDDEDVRDTIVDVLTFSGYRVEAVADGHRALEALHKADALPWLMVLDLEMPNMNGWQLVAELKKSERLSEIPYVIFSASGCRDASVAALGAVACVPKGGSPHELVRAVERWSLIPA